MDSKQDLSVKGLAERPEVELLLCCARTSRDSEADDRIRALLQKEMDWAYLLRMAYRHRTAPLLYWNLNAVCPQAVPKTALYQLRDHFHANNLRNLLLTRELLKLLNLFAAHGVSAVPFKGPALASLAYENLALREFIDLDVLVYERDVPKARELLASLGYRPQYRLTRRQEVAFLRYEREYTFVRDDPRGIVELHWKVAPRPFAFSLNTDRLWGRLKRISLGSDTILTFSPEDLILFLCVHGAVHLWARLEWICDIAELVRVHETMDWGQLVEQASASGSERMLLLGLFLASDLVGADLPEKVMKMVRADATVVALAGQVHERLFPTLYGAQGVFNEESHFHPFHLRVMERLRDRIGYCARQATTPIMDDWVLRPLPAPLFPLYRVLRPMRLLGKYKRRSTKLMSR